MEGKFSALSVMVMSILLMGLFLVQTPVEAKYCCKDTAARNCFNRCLLSPPLCAERCGCINVPQYKCPRDYPKMNDFLNSEAADEANIEEAYSPNEFCKLGCVSSVCGNIIALHKSAELGPVNELEEVVKEAGNRCNDACSQFCNKKSDTAVVAEK